MGWCVQWGEGLGDPRGLVSFAAHEEGEGGDPHDEPVQEEEERRGTLVPHPALSPPPL